MKFWILPIAAFSLSIAGCKKVTVERPAEEEAAAENQPAAQDETVQLKIEELEREIEKRSSLISDMEAFVLMERAKIDDDPEYDRSFMEEALSDQQHQRELIERAQQQIEKLENSEE